MVDLPDPGPETVDKILDDLEEARWSPAEVARQARRLRAHIEGLRARVRICKNIHGDDALYDPELAELAGEPVSALRAGAEAAASGTRRRFKTK